MTGLIDDMLDRLPADTITSLGNFLGLDTQQMTRGVGAVAPLLACGLARAAKQPATLESFMALLPPGPTDRAVGLLNSLSAGALSEVDDRLLELALGNGQHGALRYLQERLGFDARPLVAAGTPLLLNAVRDVAQEEKLDAAGVGALLERETQSWLAADTPTARLVSDALAAGEKSAALRERFTLAQWTQIRMAPLAAAAVVMSAAVSGKGGQERELGAAIEAVLTQRDVAAAETLTTAAYATVYSDEELDSVNLKRVEPERLLSVIRSATATVAEQTPEEVRAFRTLILKVVTQTAEAAAEGGFLGIGSVQVSEPEKQAIDAIRKAVNA
jgi:hypothetical protein